jgi:hypothetical protein
VLVRIPIEHERTAFLELNYHMKQRPHVRRLDAEVDLDIGDVMQRHTSGAEHLLRRCADFLRRRAHAGYRAEIDSGIVGEHGPP